MLTFNQVTALGYAAGPPKVFESGAVRFAVCTSERYKTKNGEEREDKKWWQCVAFAGTARYIAENVGKGTPLLIQGKCRDTQWTDKDTGEVRYGHEVLVSRCIHIRRSKPQHAEPAEPEAPDYMEGGGHDDIPF